MNSSQTLFTLFVFCLSYFFCFYLVHAEDYGSFLTISFKISFSIFCILIIDIWNTNIVCVTAIVLSMGTQFVNKEEIVSGTRSEDSVTLCLSSLRVLTEMYKYVYFLLSVLFDRKNIIKHARS